MGISTRLLTRRPKSKETIRGISIRMMNSNFSSVIKRPRSRSGRRRRRSRERIRRTRRIKSKKKGVRRETLLWTLMRREITG